MSTKIEWATEVWNPVTGCNLVSSGCTNCYAMHQAHRMAAHPNEKVAGRYRGTTRLDANGKPIWSGQILTHEDTLNKPLSWRKPRRCFVNSMSDLFHESVPFDFIAKVWVVMKVAKEHTFMILTKRPKRMYDFLNWNGAADIIPGFGFSVKPGDVLHNVWLGISAEDQDTYYERARHLNACRATVRFLSLEPLLSPIYDIAYPTDWIIVGGESGKNARPLHPNWVRSIRRHCLKTDTPFFFKQWGEWVDWRDTDDVEQARFDDGLIVYRVGKHKAGHLLDGFKEMAKPKP